MRWEDQGVLISVKRYGETSALLELLTKSHGKRAGLLRGAFRKNINSIVQPGNQLQVTWSSRLDYGLGNFKVELLKSRFHTLNEFQGKIQLLNLICGFCSAYLPERYHIISLYKETVTLLDSEKESKFNLLRYIQWEMILLKDLGFGLDLRKCVVTGSSYNLSFVSPRSGCAVSNGAAVGWEKKLLVLPKFLLKHEQKKDVSKKEFEEGLNLTGYFLRKWLSPVKNFNSDVLFEARNRLSDYIN